MVAGLEIDEADYDLVIDYGAVTYVAPGQVLYRTQLLGLENTWSSPHPHRFARYTNLRPGDYTFRVAARNWGGQWSMPCEWRFHVIRNRHAHELELARQRAEAAEAAVRVRNDVLSEVAHDLRAPLTSIMGHTDLMKLRLERDEPPSQDWLRARAGALRGAAQRMSAMVEEIVDVAQLQLGQDLTLRMAPVDVGMLVHEVLRALEVGAGREHALEADTPHGLVVEGDQVRLERVVQNLIGNAVKYSPAGTPVRIAVQSQDDGAIISVRDRGVGIPASELAHIFTPFYRASTSRGIPGTGLGLAGAKAIVEQHGGSIALESCVGQGTTVTVYLPYRATDM